MLTRLVDLLLYTMTKTSQAVKTISGFEKNKTRFFLRIASRLYQPASRVAPSSQFSWATTCEWQEKKSDLLGWCLLGPSVLRRLSLVLRSRGERWRS